MLFACFIILYYYVQNLGKWLVQIHSRHSALDRGVMQWRLWRLKPALKILVEKFFLLKEINMKI